MVSRCRRVLFVTPPGYGHAFPLIPLAWATRCAGHAVLVATCGVSVSACTRAGLSVVNVAPGVDLPSLYARHRAQFQDSVPAHVEPQSTGVESVFTALGEMMTPGVLRVAREWPAEVIVYTPDAAAGLIAATCLGLPAVFLALGLSYTPAVLADTLLPTLAGVCASVGVTPRPWPAAWIDTAPPSLRDAASDGWPMQTLPYNGGAVLDGPPREHKPERPRVVVTLGTVVPFVTGLAPLARLLCAARGVDATFVVAHGAARAPELEPLPPNVQAASWIGFDVLLPSCHALVHHGGSGTALAALAAGLPQLVMPCGADHFVNASTLVRAGVAVRCDAADVTAAGLASFLADESLRRRAADLRAEIAAMPTPADVVPRLVALT